ncbi:MAG: tetratricopeptide repeat protein [Candidatus Krumholzibacteria bacterium]|nr:tetratricopeptide repeat protein [Candidatus Krumholzibacteria bacterium]
MKVRMAIAAIVLMSLRAVGGTVWGQDEPPAAIEELTEVFRTANASYETGDYEAAITQYRRLVDRGIVDADLFYNLGNAYYKSNDLGNSVLFYLRSLRLLPRSSDAKDNLALVRSQLRDKQFVRDQNRIVRGVVWLHNNLNTTEMMTFASASYVVFCLLTIALIFRGSALMARIYRKVSIVSPGRLIGLSFTQDLLLAMGVVATLLVTSGISVYSKLELAREFAEAVVIDNEIPVFSSPTNDATLQFKIHEGTVVRIRDERRDWIKIELPGKMSGWVAPGSIEKV